MIAGCVGDADRQHMFSLARRIPVEFPQRPGIGQRLADKSRPTPQTSPPLSLTSTAVTGWAPQ